MLRYVIHQLHVFYILAVLVNLYKKKAIYNYFTRFKYNFCDIFNAILPIFRKYIAKVLSVGISLWHETQDKCPGSRHRCQILLDK